MASEGRLQPQDLVWNQSMGDQWIEAGKVPELVFPSKGSAAPALPVSADSGAPVPAMPSPGQPTPMGMVENREIMRRARATLKGKWGLGVGVILIYILLTQLPSNLIPLFGAILTLVVAGPLMLGMSRVFLKVSRSGDAEVGQLFEGFQYFGNSLGAYLLSTLFIFLWTLLLIIPGIIAGISYSMIYFILSDHPETSPSDAITLSKEMMRGYKWQYFCLGFRFLGWILLSIFLTLGIGMLWVMPYMQTSYAHFYQMVRSNYRPDAV